MAPELGNDRRTVIESLGVYLPPREVSTDEVLRGCRRPVRFPLERLTGIASRHVAGETEFALDLARQAIVRCLAKSQHQPQDVDVVISAAIARIDEPGFAVAYEPSTALRLKAEFGFDRAVAFDIRSACSGMFAAMNIAEALIRRGTVSCCLVVSGEYITHLTATAQREIDSTFDSRLACLTLGDSGAAVMLAAARTGDAGFTALDLCTLGAYAKYCVAGPSEGEHGGGIMHTDSMKLTDAATTHGATHAMRTLQRNGWAAADIGHLIMHQTSRTAMTSASRAINQKMGARICRADNTIDNLARCGNTATTAHMVAFADAIQSGRIRSGDRVVFAISGSGLTIGTGLYTLDDLPDRLRIGFEPADRATTQPTVRQPAIAEQKVRVRGVATAAPLPEPIGRDTMDVLSAVGMDCLHRTGLAPTDIGLLIYAGTYRSGFIAEPAIAALAAGQLGMNATNVTLDGPKTLAFDVFNGGVGVLNACWVASRMINAAKAERAMVLTSETENNAAEFPDSLLGIEETGAAMMLEPSPDQEGFGAFRFRAFPEHVNAFVSHWTNRDLGRPFLRFSRADQLEQLYLRAVVQSIDEFIAAEGTGLDAITRIFPPQISTEFITRLSEAMGLPRERFVDVAGNRRDLFTGSIPYAMQHAWDNHLVGPGDRGLLVSVGSGIQVACVCYDF